MTGDVPDKTRRLAATSILAVVALIAAALLVRALLHRSGAPTAVPVETAVRTASRPSLATLIHVTVDRASGAQPSTTALSKGAPPPATGTDKGDGAELVVRRVLDTGGPIRYGSYFWDDAGVPTGPLVITVDLAAETISAFRDGYEIGTAAIIFGDRGKETPLGVFPITQKDADHVSNLYDAPMPYMLRLTNDGISIHGSKVSWEYATHGCIGVPIGFAKKLFGAAKLGDKVIVTRGRMMTLGQRIEGPAA